MSPEDIKKVQEIMKKLGQTKISNQEASALLERFLEIYRIVYKPNN